MNTVNDPKGEAGSKKAPMWLLPPVALEQTAWVHKLGNDKYGPFNWRKTGVCATTYVSAIMRHLNAWRDGEDLDPESGISHIAHVATSCNILMDAAACGTLQDDRNKRPARGFLNRFVAEFEEAMSKVSDEELVESFREMGCDVEIVPPAGQIEIDGKLVDLPPVPEGYDRWVDRGCGWLVSRPVTYACYSGVDGEWVLHHDDFFTCGALSLRYIEAVKDSDNECQKATVAPLPGTVKVVDHDLEAGDVANVRPLHSYGFTTTIEKIVDLRGEKVYTFSNGSKYTESELYTITRA